MDLKYPDLVNTLYLAAGKDLEVSDTGDINLDVLANAKIAVLSYQSTGKYKRNLWNRVSSWEDTDQLEKDFEKSVKQGYPQNFRKGASEPAVPEVQESVSVDDLPF